MIPLKALTLAGLLAATMLSAPALGQQQQSGPPPGQQGGPPPGYGGPQSAPPSGDGPPSPVLIVTSVEVLCCAQHGRGTVWSVSPFVVFVFV